MNDHFEGKDAIQHVVEKHAKGVISSSESHGLELPGPVSAATDAAKDSCIALLILWTTLRYFGSFETQLSLILLFFGVGFLIWKAGRSAWLSWSHLERLHRLVEEEQYEIDHHREDEKEELRELYAAKGFEGALLDEVVEVLMSDGDRLLRVMLQEELGLSLEVYEHPLKQGLGAGFGVLLSLTTMLLTITYLPPACAYLAAAFVIAGCSILTAYYERNRIISALVWNLAIATLAFSSVHFLLQWVLQTNPK